MKPFVVAVIVLGLSAGIWFRFANDRESGDSISPQVPTHGEKSATSPAVDAGVRRLNSSEARQTGNTNEATPIGPAGTDRTTSSLSISIDVLQPEGIVRVAVFDESADFPDRQDAKRTVSAAVQGTTVHLVVDDLVPGTYAVAAFQDLNADGILNKNPLGVPTEPYGFSRNARGTFGPPPFQAACFRSPQTEAVSITVK